jgi:hypothetical protein
MSKNNTLAASPVRRQLQVDCLPGTDGSTPRQPVNWLCSLLLHICATKPGWSITKCVRREFVQVIGRLSLLVIFVLVSCKSGPTDSSARSAATTAPPSQSLPILLPLPFSDDFSENSHEWTTGGGGTWSLVNQTCVMDTGQPGSGVSTAGDPNWTDSFQVDVQGEKGIDKIILGRFFNNNAYGVSANCLEVRGRACR